MKGEIGRSLIQVAIAALLTIGHFFGIEEATNIVIAITWFISIVSLIAASIIPSKDFFKDSKNSRNKILRIQLACNVILMSGTGLFFTAAIVSIAWITLWIKREIWEQEKNDVSQ